MKLSLSSWLRCCPHALLLLLSLDLRGVSAVEPLTNDNIKYAIDLWQHNQTGAEALYGGPIEEWNTSRVTSLGSAFQGCENFNADLSKWNVAAVTDMAMIFYSAKSFGANLQGWDTSRVQDLTWAFHSTEYFHANVSSWDITSVTNMDSAFKLSKDFSSDVSAWKPSNVEDMASAFYGSDSFQSDLSKWDVSAVTSMTSIFEGSTDLKAPSSISSWDTSKVTDFARSFYKASWFTTPICWDLNSAEPNQMGQFSCLTHGGFACNCSSLKRKKQLEGRLGAPTDTSVSTTLDKKKKKTTDFCQFINSRCTGRDPAPPCVPVPNTQSLCPLEEALEESSM